MTPLWVLARPLFQIVEVYDIFTVECGLDSIDHLLFDSCSSKKFRSFITKKAKKRGRTDGRRHFSAQSWGTSFLGPPE